MIYKYTVENKFSNCFFFFFFLFFLKCQIHHIRLLWSDYCIKIHTPITGEGISGKKKKKKQRQEFSMAAFVLA